MGRRLLPCRDHEGFYTRLLGFDDQARGVEAYDRAMITPDFDVTGDIQLLDGALPSADEWAIVPGVRANLRF